MRNLIKLNIVKIDFNINQSKLNDAELAEYPTKIPPLLLNGLDNKLVPLAPKRKRRHVQSGGDQTHEADDEGEVPGAGSLLKTVTTSALLREMEHFRNDFGPTNINLLQDRTSCRLAPETFGRYSIKGKAPPQYTQLSAEGR